MKKFLTSLFGFALFFGLTPTSFAEFSVVPSPPHERQFNFEIPAGQSQEASIIVRNLGNSSITVSTYSTDGTNSSQGTFAITSKSHEQKHIGTWVEFENPTTTILPKQDVTIPFTLNIPENVTPGNYGGGIAVEASSAELKNEEELNGAGAVSTAARIYVRTFIKVPGDKIHDYEWTNFNYNEQTATKKSSFNFSFKNNGNTIIIAEPSVSLMGFPPLKEGTLKLPEVTIQPGTALEDLELRWDDKPPLGFYFVTAQVDFAEFDIIINKKVNEATFQQKMTINLTPGYITAIMLGVILILLGFLIFRVITRKQLISRSKPYKVKDGDTITSIAKGTGVSWKEIAKINKISSPYTLKSGQTILVPPKNNLSK